MSNVEISSTVTSADGKVIYKESYSVEATQAQLDWLNTAIAKAGDHANKLAAEPKEDDDSYTCTLKATIGPNVFSDLVLPNVSYNAVVKQANYWQQHVTGEILKAGEKVAKQKEKDARR